MYSKTALVLGALVVCANPVGAQELVDNPEFASWSQFKPGTRVTLKSINSSGPQTSEVILTTTLLEVGPDKLVTENVALVKGKEKDFKSEPEKREVLKKIPLPKGFSRADFAANKPPGTTAEGIETLKLAGLELKAKWYKYQADEGGVKIAATRWVSNEVPGMIAKSEITTTGSIRSSTKLELVEIKKP